MSDIDIIVLTGGPCSGKTTGLNTMQEKALNAGIHVMTLSETATELLQAGFVPGVNISWQEFEERLIRYQIARENEYIRMFRVTSPGKKLLLCDRGVRDAKPYTPDFKKAIQSIGHKESELDERYNAAIHLTTAAIGAEDFYTNKNNKFRLETLQEARERDKRTYEAWVGHPSLVLIDNSTDFEGKMQRLWAAICRIIGLPEPIEEERRFLIQTPDFARFKDAGVDVIVPARLEQMYLKSTEAGVEERIRKRSQYGGHMYDRTRKVEKGGTRKRVETKRKITEVEYAHLAASEADEQFEIIRKTRHCFVWNYEYFELDIFEYPHTGLCILEVELTKGTTHIEIPPCVEVMREITGERKFTNRELARK